MRFFTTVDAVKDFYQIKLHLERQPLATFITPWCRYVSVESLWNPECIVQTRHFENQDSTLNDADMKVNPYFDESWARTAASQLSGLWLLDSREICACMPAIVIDRQQKPKSTNADDVGASLLPFLTTVRTIRWRNRLLRKRILAFEKRTPYEQYFTIATITQIWLHSFVGLWRIPAHPRLVKDAKVFWSRNGIWCLHSLPPDALALQLLLSIG